MRRTGKIFHPNGNISVYGHQRVWIDGPWHTEGLFPRIVATQADVIDTRTGEVVSDRRKGLR